MVVLLTDLQRFMGREGQVSGFAIVVDHPDDKAEIERIRHDIEALGKNIEATPTAEFVNSTTEIRFIRAMAWVTSAVALVIGAVGMLNTMVMSVFERTREIGILRAIGWGRWRVVRMILMESILLSLTGGVVGTAGAVALTHVLGQPARRGRHGRRLHRPRRDRAGIRHRLVRGTAGGRLSGLPRRTTPADGGPPP